MTFRLEFLGGNLARRSEKRLGGGTRALTERISIQIRGQIYDRSRLRTILHQRF